MDEGIEVVNEIKLDLFSFTKYGKPEKVHEMFKENVTLSGLEEGSEEDVKEATKIKDDFSHKNGAKGCQEKLKKGKAEKNWQKRLDHEHKFCGL